MKVKANLILSIILIIGVVNTITAQNVNIDIVTESNLMSKSLSERVSAQGSPYINETFLPLKIKGYANQVYTGRYNAYNGEMEVNLGSKIIALDVKNDMEVLFTQTNKIYKTYYYQTDSGISKRGFLLVIKENDSFSLLKREYVKYYEKVKAASSYQKDKPAKFKRESDTYFIKKGNSVSYMPTKKKDLLSTFPKHAKAIKAYLKENKLSPNKEEHLIQIAQYIATL
jgi:hypothetical protein